MDKIDREERRRLRRQRWEEDKRKRVEEREKNKEKKNDNFHLIAVGVVIVLVVGGIGYFVLTTPELESKYGIVHWHSEIQLILCGEERRLPLEAGSHGVLHTHDDDLMHIEGNVRTDEDVTVGNAMDAIGITFTETSIDKYENGDTCPDGTVGEVKIFVNGAENQDFRNYSMRDGDKISIVFG